MKVIILLAAVFYMVFPYSVLAQSDGSIPTETPVPVTQETPILTPEPTVELTPAATIGVPRVTPTPFISSSPAPVPSSSATPLLSPEPEEATLVITTAQVGSNSILGIVILLIASASAMAGFTVYKSRAKRKKDDSRCGSIREVLEQKKKELEEIIRNMPADRLKEIVVKAGEKAVDELKNNEDARKVIEAAESLKARHDKLKEMIELLQKRYDLCMLELPSTDKLKTLKFKGFKAKAILEGEKTATIRLFDDKDLKKGDNLRLINSDEDKSFTEAEIMEVIQKKLGDIDADDLEGHEKWNTKEEMIESLRKYYGDTIDLDTPAKIVRFKVK